MVEDNQNLLTVAVSSVPTLVVTGYEYVEPLPANGLLVERWKARSVQTNRWVTIKVLPPVIGEDSSVAESFLTESQRLLELRHPILESVLDIGIKGSYPFHLAEFVDGVSLMDWIREGRTWGEKDALALVEDIAAALEYAWRQGSILHGYLGPERVYLDRQDRIFVTDLGLLRLLERAIAGRAASWIRPASRYTAPEQILYASAWSCQADMYSLGSMLHTLLTGEPPFSESSDIEAMHRHATGFLPDPRDRRPQISDACVWLIERLTVKDPAERPATWADVRADMEAVRAGGTPAGDRPPPGAATVRRNERRERRPVLSSTPSNGRRLRRKPAPVALGTFEPLRDATAPARPRMAISPSLPRRPGRKRNGRMETREQRLSLGLVIALALAAGVYWRFFHSAFFPPPAVTTIAAPPSTEKNGNGVRRVGRLLPDGTMIRDNDFRASPEQENRGRIRTMTQPLPLAPLPIQPGHDNGEADANEENSGRSPGYTDLVRGARAFNEALALFKRYERDRNANVLPRVERLAREAADAFEAYEKAAPQDPMGRRYADQAYGMIRYARQAMLMEGIVNKEPSRHEPSENRLSPSPARALRLAAGWNVRVSGADPVARDLDRLLVGRGTPGMDLLPHTDLFVMEGVPYLMPLKTLASARGGALSAGRFLQGAAFPAQSFKAYPLSKPLHPEYPFATVLTDLDEAIVAIHLFDERLADRPVLPPALFSDRWTTYDFLTPRFRQNEGHRVAHRVRVLQGVVQVDSELAEADPARPDGIGRSLYRSRLLLPQPVVNLMLMRLYVARGSPSG